MNLPNDLLYTKSHEWVLKTGDKTVRIGLTDYAQEEMGDIVFVNLPAVGDKLAIGASFADIESVKAVSDIYSPVDGEVTEVNERLLDEPEGINTDAYGAWLISAECASFEDGLMSAEQYEAFVKEGA